LVDDRVRVPGWLAASWERTSSRRRADQVLESASQAGQPRPPPDEAEAARASDHQAPHDRADDDAALCRPVGRAACEAPHRVVARPPSAVVGLLLLLLLLL